MLFQVLWSLEVFGARFADVRLQGDVHAKVGGDVVPLDGGGLAVVPLAAQRQVSVALAADVEVAEVFVQRLGVVELRRAALPPARELFRTLAILLFLLFLFFLLFLPFFVVVVVFVLVLVLVPLLFHSALLRRLRLSYRRFVWRGADGVSGGGRVDTRGIRGAGGRPGHRSWGRSQRRLRRRLVPGPRFSWIQQVSYVRPRRAVLLQRRRCNCGPGCGCGCGCRRAAGTPGVLRIRRHKARDAVLARSWGFHHVCGCRWRFFL